MFLFSQPVYDVLLPRPVMPTAEWACRHLIMPPDSNIQGPFRLDLFPYMREWFDCFDDPLIDRITIQAASRTGKTTFTQACMAKVAVEDPHPMAFADADQGSTERVFERTWRFWGRSAVMMPLLPPSARQSNQRMELRTCTIHGAWAGSPATAADYAAWLVAMNETDKMKQRSTDTEADFRELMGERAKGWGAGSKVIEISTPTIKDHSYIESKRLQGDNRRRMVPCPRCDHFQELVCGDGKAKGGIRFDRLASGKLDVRKAEDTAYYQCANCEERIEERERPAMVRAGLWVPEGCAVVKGKLTGEPARAGRHASFGPLSSLHSLLPRVGIPQFAAKYVSALTALNKLPQLQNVANSWGAVTWDPRPAGRRPDELDDLLGVDEELGVCPAWSRFVTVGADIGMVGEELWFYWMALAWGRNSRSQIIQYGLTHGKTQFREQMKTLRFPHKDGGEDVVPIRFCIDSGTFTQQIYELCDGQPNWFATKGSSAKDDPKQGTSPFVVADFNEMYSEGFQRAGLHSRILEAKRRARAFDLLVCNTNRTEQWVEQHIGGLVKASDDNRLTIPRAALQGEAVAGLNLPRHITGDYRDDKGRWLKKYREQDLRDALRYAVVGAWHYTSNGRNWDREMTRTSGLTVSAPTIVSNAKSGFIRRPGAGFLRRPER